MVGAKKASKKAREAAAEVASGGSGKGKGGGNGKPQKKTRARDEIVPWGWESAAKDERKKKSAERMQADAAAKAAKELAELGIADKPAKKQPTEAAAPAADKKGGDKKK